MAKRKPSKKKRAIKVLSLILFVIIAIFSIVCYFNPSIYNKILDFLKNNDLSLLGNINREDYYADELGTMNVHFIDIGQGDAILIQLPDTKTMLIDSGDNKTDNNTKLVTYIEELGITKIDYLVATHADADHIGGMNDIFYNFEVKKVFRPYVYYNGDDYNFSADYNKGSSAYKQSSKTYGKFLNDILNETYTENGQTKTCEWEFFNYQSDFGGNILFENSTYSYTVDFLTPFKDFEDINYEDANDYSPFIKISYCNYDMMFTGDAEAEAERDFISEYSKTEEYKKYVDVELLKVSHHGSGTSTTDAFLKLIKPEIAVISCGEDNSYFHPHQEVLDRLIENNCNVLYRTDKNGDIVITIDASGANVPDTSYDSTDNFKAPEKPN